MRMQGRDGGRMRNAEWGMRRGVRGRMEKAKEKGDQESKRGKDVGATYATCWMDVGV